MKKALLIAAAIIGLVVLSRRFSHVWSCRCHKHDDATAAETTVESTDDVAV